MKNIIRLEPEFGVVTSLPWGGSGLVLGIGAEEALGHFPAEGNNDERNVNKFLKYILENYPNASLCEIRTKKGKLLTTLNLSSKEEVDRLCADDNVRVKAVTATVSVPWDGENVDIAKDYGEALNYFTIQGGCDDWRALSLIKQLEEGYESVATLSRMKRKGEKLCATLRFYARDKEDFDLFCKQYS